MSDRIHVFLVTAECGDYYCGCGLGHLVGIYSDEERARQAVEHAEDCKRVYSTTNPDARRYRRWASRAQIDIVNLDMLPAKLVGEYEQVVETA